MKFDNLLGKMLPDDIFYPDCGFAPVIPIEKDNNRFGYVLSIIRKWAGLSQTELQLRIYPNSHRGGATISNWEKGIGNTPNTNDIVALSKALGLSDADQEYLLQLSIQRPKPPMKTLRPDEITERARIEFHQYLESLPQGGAHLPAYIIDERFFIVDVNSNVEKMYVATKARIETFRSSGHLLDTNFNPIFSAFSRFENFDDWAQIAKSNIDFFRMRTGKWNHFRHEEWYIQLLRRLATRGYYFIPIWYSPPSPPDPKGPSVSFVNHTSGKQERYKIEIVSKLLADYGTFEIIRWVEDHSN